MKQFRITILLIATTLLLCACPEIEEVHRNIVFVNKSGKRVAYQFAFSKIQDIYEDTVFNCNKTSEGFIENDSSFILDCPIRERSWEISLGNSYYIQYLVLDGDKFSQYYTEPCDTIRKYVPVLHTYRLTLADLQRMNWTVVYPPEK
ncbi:MAG TPA: hypothetical protein PLQ60_07545 [Paludibacteraceae bacterium]|jgi:hypothetical protein|nr:hypothetical protein [Paludibacteraceae bacterium]